MTQTSSAQVGVSGNLTAGDGGRPGVVGVAGGNAAVTTAPGGCGAEAAAEPVESAGTRALASGSSMFAVVAASTSMVGADLRPPRRVPRRVFDPVVGVPTAEGGAELPAADAESPSDLGGAASAGPSLKERSRSGHPSR